MCVCVCVCVLNLRDLTNFTDHYNFYVALVYKHFIYIYIYMMCGSLLFALLFYLRVFKILILG
jgi:hypothetical protein